MWTAFVYFGNGGGTTLLIDSLSLEVDDMEFDIEIDNQNFEIEIEKQEFDIEIDNQNFEIEIC